MSISPKNDLQEFCQKNKLKMPVYKSRQNNNLKWISDVTVGKYFFKGKNQHNKKTNAENHVATIAYNFFSKKSIKIGGEINYTDPVDPSDYVVIDILYTDIDSNLTVSVFDDNSNVYEQPDSLNCTETDTIDAIDDIDTIDAIQISNNSFVSIDKIDTIYMIDLENKPFNNEVAKSNMLFIGFISSTHHSIIKYQKKWLSPQTDDIYEEVKTNKNNMLIYDIGGGVADLADHYMTMFIYKIVDLIRKLNRKISVYIISGDHAAYCTRICLEKALKWSNNLACMKSEVINSIIF